ncbi:MAG: hypothetical protein DRH57_07675 [Candidatus Cloacimonadota bacterium]|nr:MAG: hypothetical protein DRH57_07675 [Candidatus Cloacimonadota bacterium]
MNKKIAFYPTPHSISLYMHELSGAKNNSKLLEAGFGDGAFLNVFRNNTNVHGIEYDTLFATEAMKRFPDFNIEQGDYLSFDKSNSFDNITGNPPYITSDSLDVNIKENIRRITQSGEGNIYYAFIIHSINNLVDGGVLTYILPYDFFFNTFAKYTREFMIDNGYFTDIIDFGESKIFKGAAPETIIFRYVKGVNAKNKQINVKQTKSLSLLIIEDNILNGFKDFDCYDQPQFLKEQNIWFLSKQKIVDGIKLKDIDGLKISVGIVNGAETQFLFTDDGTFTAEEKSKYVKSFIKNKNRPIDTNNMCLDGIEYVFYNGDFTSEDNFQETALNVYNYIAKNKTEMLKRKLPKSKKWYEYLAIRNLPVFEENKNKLKIHVPSLTRLESGWFFKSKNDFYVGGDLLTITLLGDQEKLAAIFQYLNSSEFVAYYKATGAKKGKRTVFTQSIVSNIIIPNGII